MAVAIGSVIDMQVAETPINFDEIDLNEQPTCRICHCEEGALVQACDCKGSLALIHKQCLMSWIEIGTGNPKNLITLAPFIILDGKTDYGVYCSYQLLL